MRRLFAVGPLVAALLAAPAGAGPLSVALPEGAALAGLRAAYVEPFLQAGSPVSVSIWPGGAAALAEGAPAWDVVALGAGGLQAGCAAGVLAKLPWGEAPLRERPGPADGACGLGVGDQTTVLAWERDKVQGSPGWADFWDVVRVPGKRALREGVRGNLEIALLADGVPPGEVYRTLRSEAGADRALRKLGQLRPYLTWWRTPDDALRILRSGEAVMGSMPAAALVAANQNEAQLAAQPVGALAEPLFLAIPAASANRAMALRLLAFAAEPAQQAAFAAREGRPQAGTPRGALMLDEGFWRDNLEKLTTRFEAMVIR